MATIMDYVNGAHTKRFKWGEHDCFLFAAGAVQVVTGIDYMANLRGYRDETTAEVLLRERFGTTKLRDVFLTVALEYAKQIPLEDAQDGDIACVNFGPRFERSDKIDQSCGLGVFYDFGVYCCTPAGLLKVNRNRIIDVWSFR